MQKHDAQEVLYGGHNITIRSADLLNEKMKEAKKGSFSLHISGFEWCEWRLKSVVLKVHSRIGFITIFINGVKNSMLCVAN